MPPNRPAKLDLSSVLSSENGNSSNDSPKLQSHPTSVSLVVSGSISQKTVDALTISSNDSGFCSDSSIKLRGVVYELSSSGESPSSAAEGFTLGRDAMTNLPIGIVTPLVNSAARGQPPALPKQIPAPAHLSLNYSLPTIRSDADFSNVEDWVAALKLARQNKYTLDFGLQGSDGSETQQDELEKVREKIEEILGKAHQEVAAAQQEEGGDGKDAEKGGFIVFDAFASPPLHIPSSSLPRSKELQAWATFVGRLALHPQTYIKLSPLPFASPLGNPLTTPTTTRAADHSSSLIQTTTEVLTSAISSTIQSAGNAAASLAGTTAAREAEGSIDSKEELSRRVRIFLEILLEAFGVERLIWSVHLISPLSSIRTLASSSSDQAAVKALEAAIKEWYEIVRNGLIAMGLGRQGELDSIFSDNASKVYRM